MSDDQVRAILKRYGPLLHEALTNPRDTHAGEGYVGNWRFYDGHLQSAVRLTQWEAHQWNIRYDVLKRMTDTLQKGEFYVDDGKIPGDDGFRLNLEEVVNNHAIEPIKVLKPTFYMVPYAYVGYNGPGEPYNSFIQMRLHAKQGGKWLLTKIPGSGVLINSSPVYHPVILADCDISFNLRIESEKPNSLIAGSNDNPRYSDQKCEIHHLDQLDSLEIPNSPCLRFTFWQLSRIMHPMAWFLRRRALI